MIPRYNWLHYVPRYALPVVKEVLQSMGFRPGTAFNEHYVEADHYYVVPSFPHVLEVGWAINEPGFSRATMAVLKMCSAKGIVIDQADVFGACHEAIHDVTSLEERTLKNRGWQTPFVLPVLVDTQEYESRLTDLVALSGSDRCYLAPVIRDARNADSKMLLVMLRDEASLDAFRVLMRLTDFDHPETRSIDVDIGEARPLRYYRYRRKIETRGDRRRTPVCVGDPPPLV